MDPNLALLCANLLFNAALVGVAIYGVRQWQSELRYGAKLEVARKLGFLALQFKNEFRTARSTGTFKYEYAGRSKQEKESHEESSFLDEGYARFERLKPLTQVLQKLVETNWEAEIVLKEDYRAHIQECDAAFRKLYGAVVVYFDPDYRRTSRDTRPDLIKNDEKLHALIYGTDNDDLSTSVNTAIDAITQSLKKHFR